MRIEIDIDGTVEEVRDLIGNNFETPAGAAVLDAIAVQADRVFGYDPGREEFKVKDFNGNTVGTVTFKV